MPQQNERPGTVTSRLAPRAEAEQPEAQNINPAEGSTPTPTQAENDGFIDAIVGGTLRAPYSHAQDGSRIDPLSLDPTPKTSSFT